jgi:hypothetical protein
MTAPKSRQYATHATHMRALRAAILLEIGLALEAQNITDEAAGAVVGEPVETLINPLHGRQAGYEILRLMRALERLGVPVSLSVTPASTMLRAGERKKIIRYREPAEGAR